MFTPSLSFIVSSRNRWLYTTRHGSNKISTARGLALEFSTIHRLSIGTRTPRLSRYDRQEPEKLHRIPAERRGKLKNVDETKPVETIFSSRIRGRLSNEGEERKKKKKKRVAKKYYSTSRGKVLNVSSLLFIRVLYATSFFFLFPFFWKPETELPICNSVTGNSGFLFNKEKHFTSYILLISPEYGSRGFSSRIFFNM